MSVRKNKIQVKKEQKYQKLTGNYVWSFEDIQN